MSAHSREVVPTLIIEDNHQSVMALEAILDNAPCYRYQVMTARTLQEALELLVKVPFDLIILDLKLPDAKNVEALQAIRDEHKEIPVVIWTGSKNKDLERLAFSLNADSYIVKAEHSIDEIRWMVRTAVVAHKAGRRFKPLDSVIEKAEEMIKMSEADPDLPPYK